MDSSTASLCYQVIWAAKPVPPTLHIVIVAFISAVLRIRLLPHWAIGSGFYISKLYDNKNKNVDHNSRKNSFDILIYKFLRVIIMAKRLNTLL